MCNIKVPDAWVQSCVTYGGKKMEKMKEVRFQINPDEIKRLPPMDRKRYIQKMILNVLKNNPNGVTVPFLMRNISLNRRTIREHLEYLVAIREAYKRDMGTAVYYPNGRVLHSAPREEVKIGDKYYSFEFIQNPFGEFLYVQEKEKDDYNISVVKGGLIIKKEDIDDFILKMKKIEEKIKNE